MNKKFFLPLLLLILVSNCIVRAQDSLTHLMIGSNPLRETRAVWLTTIGGIDWPHRYATSNTTQQVQKQEFCDILDKLCSAGINTVLLQTRVRATTIFDSNMEPWDGCLSGVPGKGPGYDALQFSIEECHKRGLKLHAWVVTIPVGKWNGIGCKKLRNLDPKLVIKIGNEGYMNPEYNGTSNYLAEFCRDIVTRYNVDGVHLDYIRYPESWIRIKNHEKGREYITSIVEKIHKSVKSVKPWVMLSCSPIGKYANTKRQDSRGWNARDIVCQDATQWLKMGIMDALFPMMYFRDNNFYPFLVDWSEQSHGKIIVPGLAAYMLDEKQKNWPLDVIVREMNLSRTMGDGICMFRSKFFTDNTKGVYDYTKDVYSCNHALPSVMHWYDVPAVEAPSDVFVKSVSDSTILLSWSQNAQNLKLKELHGGVAYNIYASSSYPVDVECADNLLLSSYSDTIITVPKSKLFKYYAVTAMNRYCKESLPCQMKESEHGLTYESDKCLSEQAYRLLPISNDSKFLILDSLDVTKDQLLETSTIYGHIYARHIITFYDGHLGIDINKLNAGHYILYLLNRKGFKHRLGMFSVPIR